MGLLSLTNGENLIIITNTLIMTCGGSECYSIILFHYILTYGRLTIQLIGKMFIKLVEKP